MSKSIVTPANVGAIGRLIKALKAEGNCEDLCHILSDSHDVMAEVMKGKFEGEWTQGLTAAVFGLSASYFSKCLIISNALTIQKISPDVVKGVNETYEAIKAKGQPT